MCSWLSNAFLGSHNCANSLQESHVLPARRVLMLLFICDVKTSDIHIVREIKSMRPGISSYPKLTVVPGSCIKTSRALHDDRRLQTPLLHPVFLAAFVTGADFQP